MLSVPSVASFRKRSSGRRWSEASLPTSAWRKQLSIAQSHNPVGENMRLCRRGHYCARIDEWEALESNAVSHVARFLSYHAVVKMPESNESV